LELRRKLFNSYELGKGYYVKFQVAALLRGDLKSRYEAYNIGRNGGWLSVDEIRAFEDLAPLPNNAGKVYLQPSTMKEAGVRA
jgi:phage portal protein BeeE